jgi:hypothetical protein
MTDKFCYRSEGHKEKEGKRKRPANFVREFGAGGGAKHRATPDDPHLNHHSCLQ